MQEFNSQTSSLSWSHGDTSGAKAAAIDRQACSTREVEATATPIDGTSVVCGLFGGLFGHQQVIGLSDGCEPAIENRQLRLKNTYGEDPFSPKGELLKIVSSRWAG